MSLNDIIDKVIVIVREEIIGIAGAEDYSLCKGVYDGDQMSYSAYPVICIGVPSLLDETFPVIARQTVRDESYAIEIVAYVKVEDTAGNARQLRTLTDSIRKAIRDDIKLVSAGPLAGYVDHGEIGDSRFVYGAKGDILLRVSVTIIKYIKRITP